MTGILTTPEEFKRFVADVEAREGYQRPFAFGIGIGHLDSEDNLLDVWYPVPNCMGNFGTAAVFADVCAHLGGTASYRIRSAYMFQGIFDRFAAFANDGNTHPNINMVRTALMVFEREQVVKKQGVVISFIAPPETDPGPQDIADVYLRLHLLSHRLVKPNGISLANMFTVLPNLAWTSEGPMPIREVPARKLAAMARNELLTVRLVDKIPPMLEYVVPSGVRIADGSRVRLGAYLGEGTTVMHEGFVNFNAGCEGPNMIEGRISQGVWIGAGSDLGGGSSTMGTLSGGGKERISVGNGTLVGANAGIGISLGDRCTVEAGLYVTAGMPVLYNGTFVKAQALSGKHDLLFRRNGERGSIEAIDKPNEVALNTALHAKQ